ncbi:MAG: hypothetical protein PHY72_01360 [Candidatus Pacebacteria bacterium]|nr:hypothetical protein [Candidatus Paceibacterota bacterium]
MTNERKKEIALLLIKQLFRQKGVRLTPDIRREIGNEAKAIGISLEETMEFTELIVRELVEETFAKPKQEYVPKVRVTG